MESFTEWSIFWCYNFVNLGSVKATSKKVSDSEKEKRFMCIRM